MKIPVFLEIVRGTWGFLVGLAAAFGLLAAILGGLLAVYVGSTLLDPYLSGSRPGWFWVVSSVIAVSLAVMAAAVAAFGFRLASRDTPVHQRIGYGLMATTFVVMLVVLLTAANWVHKVV